MKTTYTISILFLLTILGCKVQEAVIQDKLTVFNNKEYNMLHSDIVWFNVENEARLLDSIQSFKSKNNNAELEDVVILEFLQLQKCIHEEGVQFNDCPNELQAIFDLYDSMSKEEIDWLHEPELNILKFTTIHFIVNYANNSDAFAHAKTSLKNCRNDNGFLELVVHSSDIGRCIEKRR